MTLKMIGVALTVVGCGGFGFLIASAHRRQVRMLRQCLSIMLTMESELEYRRTEVPELCDMASGLSDGAIKVVFQKVALQLRQQFLPDVSMCMQEAVGSAICLPKNIERILLLLGNSLGKFDLNGQLNGLRYVRSICEDMLKTSTKDQDVRLRSYQTLALCAGAALAILLI